MRLLLTNYWGIYSIYWGIPVITVTVIFWGVLMTVTKKVICNLDRPYNFFKLTNLEVCIHTLKYLLKGIHMHSMGVQRPKALTRCSILTQRHSRTLNSVQEVFTLTQRCSHALNCIQGLFDSQTKAFFFLVTPR